MSKFFRKVDFGNGVKYWYLGDWKFAKKINTCFYLFAQKKSEEREWYVGWPDWKFEISYQDCGYEGGCLSCSYDLLPNETPEECIRRMEKERSF